MTIDSAFHPKSKIRRPALRAACFAMCVTAGCLLTGCLPNESGLVPANSDRQIRASFAAKTDPSLDLGTAFAGDVLSDTDSKAILVQKLSSRLGNLLAHASRQLAYFDRKIRGNEFTLFGLRGGSSAANVAALAVGAAPSKIVNAPWVAGLTALSSGLNGLRDDYLARRFSAEYFAAVEKSMIDAIQNGVAEYGSKMDALAQAPEGPEAFKKALAVKAQIDQLQAKVFFYQRPEYVIKTKSNVSNAEKGTSPTDKQPKKGEEG